MKMFVTAVCFLFLLIFTYTVTFYTNRLELVILALFCITFLAGWGGGGIEKGLGPRNDVLTTCKAFILVSGVFLSGRSL